MSDTIEERIKILVQQQREICLRYKAEFTPADLDLKLGVSQDFFAGNYPLNGLRLAEEGTTCGWYLWAGEEWSDAADYFQPLHAFHLLKRCPEVLPYLGLAAGWRFLIAPGYEDVWYDEKLLSDDSR